MDYDLNVACKYLQRVSNNSEQNIRLHQTQKIYNSVYMSYFHMFLKKWHWAILRSSSIDIYTYVGYLITTIYKKSVTERSISMLIRNNNHALPYDYIP